MITTQRLLLRRWRATDLEPWARMNADPTVMEHFPAPLSGEESAAIIKAMEERWQAEPPAFAAIGRRSDGAFLGMAGLNRVRFDAPVSGCVEIGWRLARGHWGAGYATEAARGWLDYGFTRLGLEEVVAFTTEANTRSMGVMRRIGMRRDRERDFLHPLLPKEHRSSRHLVFTIGPAGS